MPQIGVFILALLTNAQQKSTFLSIFYEKKNPSARERELKEMARH